MLSTDLILKGLGGVAVVGGTTGVGVWYLTKNKTEDLRTFAERVGLSCNPTETAPTATVGLVCSKGAGNIKAKKGETDVEVSAISEGKIKVYKTSAGEDYNNNFKFVIEENDINGTSNNKLEQFETYEIKQDGDGADWKLIRKSEAKDGIKKALGLDDCAFPTGDDGCALDEAKFKKIKFEGGGEGRTAPPANTKLKISKVEGAESSDYGPFGYKVVLESAGVATISNSVSAKANTNTEFKIKRKTGSNDITLEKAWTFASLGNKVNLTCTATGDNGSTKECSLENSKKINVKDGTNKRKDATFGNEGTSKKLTFEEDVQGHNQGIKLTTSTAITLQNGTPESGSPSSIEKTTVSYEIIKDADGTWYLSKVTGGGAGG